MSSRIVVLSTIVQRAASIDAASSSTSVVWSRFVPVMVMVFAVPGSARRSSRA
jgi:hypothetical protein